MHILLDNLSAAIISVVLFLSLVTVNLNTQEMMTESTSYYAMVKQADGFIQIMRRDMQGIALARTDSADTLLAFEFDGLIGDSSAIYNIRYVPEYVSTRRTHVDTARFYRLKRMVNGLEVGGSPSIITGWEVICLTDEGQPLDNPAECKQVRITMEAASPFGDLSTVTRTSWGRTYHPPLLQ